jgi:prepilin-type N-terminal cleavage/methylation domain-containing protein
MLINMKRGFTIIEVLFAIFLITLGIGGAFGLIQRSISDVAFLEHRMIALTLAQEGAEIVHAIRNSNFIAMRSGIIDPVLGIPVAFDHNGLKAAACGGPLGCEIRCFNGGESFPICTDRGADLVEVRLMPFSNTFLNFDNGGSPYNGTYSQGGPGVPSLYKRRVTVEEPGSAECPAGNCVEVKVEVFWEERGTPKNVEVETRLYNWL